MGFQIAIDGPGGAGKSSIAKEVSANLNCIYVDTGAMYRAVSLYCIMNNIDLNDKDKVSQVVSDIKIELKFENKSQKIFLENIDVTDRIREKDTANGSSVVAVIEKVREVLVKKQQEIANNNDVVMDGRDIGSNVLKNAQVKIYLDANEQVRAKRRFIENQSKGLESNEQEILADIIQRDKRDMTREVSPLVRTDDAIYIDTSYMSKDEVVSKVIKIVNDRKA